MTKLNVRCCCEPEKIFGTLEVERVEPFLRVYICKPLPVTCTPERVAHIEAVTIKLKPFGEGHEIAVYSDDRPIEFWRGLPNFVEGALV